MKKTVCIIIFFSLSRHFLSQTTNTNHIIGVEAGVSTSFFKPEINICYIFNYKLFCAKTEFGIIPTADFGIVYKRFLIAGITSNLNKTFSIHCLTGVNGYVFNQTYTNEYYTYSHNNGRAYPMINIGCFFSLNKSHNLLIGIDNYISSLKIDRDKVTDYNSYPNFNLSLSFNYQFGYNNLKSDDKK